MANYYSQPSLARRKVKGTARRAYHGSGNAVHVALRKEKQSLLVKEVRDRDRLRRFLCVSES